MANTDLYHDFLKMEADAQSVQSQIVAMKEVMTTVLEHNAELEIENEHLRNLLQEMDTQKSKDEKPGLSKPKLNLEKLYEKGFHVCREMGYGKRRENGEPCAFCNSIIYGTKK